MQLIILPGVHFGKSTSIFPGLAQHHSITLNPNLKPTKTNLLRLEKIKRIQQLWLGVVPLRDHSFPPLGLPLPVHLRQLTVSVLLRSPPLVPTRAASHSPLPGHWELWGVRSHFCRCTMWWLELD